MEHRESLAAKVILISLSIGVLPTSMGIADELFPNQVYVVGTYAKTVVVADLNNDGIQDFVVAGWSPDYPPVLPRDGWVWALLGNADGGFTRYWGASVGNSPDAVELGDFNRDGNLDMVWVDDDLNMLMILPGNGDGSFVTSSWIDTHSSSRSVAVADFNRDGNLDFALSNSGSSALGVYLGLGNGQFSPSVAYAVGYGPGSVASADFNADGIADLAVANQGSMDVSILLGIGNGTLAPEIRFPVGSEPTALRIGDFNGDSVQDLLTVHFSLGEVNVLLGHGDGTFGLPLVSGAGGEGAASVALGDFNRDGTEDLAVSNGYTENTAILLGDGQGKFVATAPVDTDMGFDLATGDVDRDGRQDLVVVAGGGLYLQPDRVLVLHGKGDGSFGPDVPFTSTRVHDVVSEDFNGDGRADLAGTTIGEPLGTAGSLSILLGAGDGTFNVQPSIPLAIWPVSTRAGDFNGDGHPDLVVVNRGLASAGIAGDVWVLLGDGNGGFLVRQRLAAGNVPSSLVVGDFDGDTRQDLVVANAGGEPSPSVPGGLSLFPGNGDGTFAQAVNLGVILHPRFLVVGDLDADGKPDLAVAGSDSTVPWAVFILLGKGDGTFHRTTHLSPPDGEPWFMTVGDFNNDGGKDLAVIGTQFSCGLLSTYARVTLFPGRGDGSFGGPVTSGVGDCPMRMAVGDFNADRIDDLAVTSGSSGDVSLVLGSTGDALVPEIRLRTGPAPGAIAANDFDGDTRPDLAVAHFGGVSVLLNQGPFPDADEDGIPDVSDPCTDTDGDGFGNPGFKQNACPSDNCPSAFNPPQANTDGDGAGDVCDPCTDTDHDGFGDPGFQVNICLADNCPSVPNPGQSNSDGDGLGDACETCSHDPLNDTDNDGICGDVDNCPTVSNQDQADSSHDGSGDACQPALTFYGTRHAGDELQIVLSATDPQNEPLSGLLEIFKSSPDFITLPDSYASGDCSQGFFPGGVTGVGIGFTNGAIGAPYLFDLGEFLYCNDTVTDYMMAPGSCEDPRAGFKSALPLADLILPAVVCLRNTAEREGGLALTISSFDESTLVLYPPPIAVRSFPFEHGLPAQEDISGLSAGRVYRLRTTVTDGTTVPVTVEATFEYQGEARMVFVGPNSSPHALILSTPAAECTGPTGGVVTVDASGSTDSDSTPGTNDDIVSFEWVENPDQPVPVILGSGQVLNATLALGTHHIGLVVTDSKGAMDAAQTTVTVRDTTGPVLACPTVGATECTGSQGASVSVVAIASDACGPVISIHNNHTPYGADGSGVYSLGTTAVAFSATDASGNVATCSASVTVRDTTAPSLVLSASQASLWPPNHRLVPVNVTWQPNDRCDPAPGVGLVSALSSEPDDASGPGDGSTRGDIQDASTGTPDSTILLRAERSGDGSGRVYTLTYAARDQSGNTASALVIVTVPHDEGTGPEPVLMHLEGDGTPGMAHLYWNAVPGAEMYDMIQGDVSHLGESNGVIWLGPVHVLAAAQSQSSYSEGPGGPIPAAGSAFFFLVQYREGQNASGWGTESSSWPAVPSWCDISCPGESVASSVASRATNRK